VNSLKEKEDDSNGLRESMRSSVNSRKSRESVAPSITGEEEDNADKTELGKVKEGEVEEEDDVERTVIGGRRDSLVSELLSDGDVEMSGL
jgi:condensin complex subunit 3